MERVKRAGAMRSLAAFVDGCDADIFCVHDIESGDAFALATRFAREWAYRGSQALFWNARFTAEAVRDRYLPVSPLRPFDRRGLLHVNGNWNDSALSLFGTQLSEDRAQRARELRFVRTAIRAHETLAIAFVASPDRRFGFRGAGFADVTPSEAETLGCYVRGFVRGEARVENESRDIAEAMICAMTRA